MFCDANMFIFFSIIYFNFIVLIIFSVISNTSTASQSTPNTLAYIYLLDQDNNLFQFNPTTFDVTSIGTINCSTTAYAYSMALQCNGQAWTLFTDGNLYTFDIKTAQCQNTSYITDPDETILFGMYFAPNGSNNTETLYISGDSSDPPYHLATIDLNTFEISIIGYYQIISARAELTSTNDGRLFGLFEGAPYIIAEINQTNGQILSETLQNMIEYTPDSSHFAFTSYLSNFFLFVGNRSFTDIFLYDSSTNTTTKKKTIQNGIVGAGMANCT
jgi:hypothetical protein